MADIRATQANVYAAGSFPAIEMRATQAVVQAATDFSGGEVQAAQAYVLVAARGRVADPRVRAWTFTLDGHDYYVLKLGNIETLVFDEHSQEWYSWGSGDGAIWRAYHGTNWVGGRKFAQEFGSNVVVGDDGNGALYFLNTELVDDDDALYGVDVPRPFTREATGQIFLEMGYSSTPCYGVQLFGSIGQSDSDLTVTLSVSDDRGITFRDVETKTLVATDYNARVNWQSLGSMRAPGRLFRITDTGALIRIDSLEMFGDE
jgi:hypothetical protein